MTRSITCLLWALLPALALNGAAFAQDKPADPRALVIQSPALSDPEPKDPPEPSSDHAAPSTGSLILAHANPPATTTLSLESEDVPCEGVTGITLPLEIRSSSLVSVSDKTTAALTATREKVSPEGHPLRETTTRLIATTTLTAVFTTVTAQTIVTTQTFGPPGDPQLYIARTMTPILEILRHPDYRNPKKQPVLREEIRHLLTNASDFRAISSLVLSTYVNDLTAQQCAAFANRFSLLYYSGFILYLEDHADDQFAVTGDLRPNPTRARVSAKTQNPKGEAPLSFRLLARPDGWALYDVHLANVSLVGSFRKQIREILHDRHFEGLIERIDLAIASDLIASYARDARKTAQDAEAVAAATDERRVPEIVIPEGETLLHRDVESNVQISTMALSSVATTLTARGVPTTMSLCTIYSTQTQRLRIVTTTERLLATSTLIELPDDPAGVVQVTVDQVLTILRRDNYEERRKTFRHEIRDTILKAVAMELVGRLTLSHYRKKFTEPEFQDFLDAFGDLLLSNYIVHLEKYTDEKFVVESTRDISDSRVRVETRTVSKTKEIPIDFSMANIDGRWRIYDLRIEGVSLVSNFRKQFRSILLRNPPSALIERIREKVKENESQL